MKKILWIVIFAAVAGGVFFLVRDSNGPENPNPSPTPSSTGNVTGQTKFNFNNPKKSAHYESNTPAHGAILAAAPVNIVIDFNFDLADGSKIEITKDGVDYGASDIFIDPNNLSMRRDFKETAPDGLYRVNYQACWPDRSCHDGYFEFAIDRTLAPAYEDMTGKEAIVIRMSEIMFNPKNIKISRGTKVTWINDDSVEHYVNTDSHPAHTYYPAHNSRALKQGESYSLVFDLPGAYPYHCSAHADSMIANLIVL